MSKPNQNSASPANSNTVNVFHHRADNIGDKMCGPAQYFWPKRVRNVGFIYELSSPENAILGGGQVFGQCTDYSDKYHQDPPGSLVAWGVGVPVKGKRDAQVHDVASRFSLFSTRNYEWRDDLTFVPCASCMSPVFDDVPAPTQEVVMYVHRKKTPDLKPIDGIPYMTNSAQNARDVIDFIAQGETVVTSSYHGVYWAQLLGRKVVCVPYNDKFSTFQHPATTATEADWSSALKIASSTNALLEEYRSLNRQFAKDVAEVLSLDG